MSNSPRHEGAAWPFVAPWLVGAVLLYLLPLVALGGIACTKWDGLAAHQIAWVGGANFRAALHDPLLLLALRNSVVYTLANVPVQLAIALGLALLIRRARRVGLWATFFYLPHALSGVATILIWWWILNPRVGPVNAVLRHVYGWFAPLVGAPARCDVPLWFFSPDWAKPALVFMNAWQAGAGMLIILAALLRTAESLHDAARADGAGPLRRFWHVTLPQIAPAIVLNLLTGIVFSMQEFDQPFMMANYQQQNSLLFYSVYLYQCAFERRQFGYAAALALGQVAMLSAFAAAAVWLARRLLPHGIEEAPA